jgi:apolipoprotein N-acyltransferase
MRWKLYRCYCSSFGHALIAAALLWAALPPLDFWPLAWIAPAWWVLLVRRGQLPGRRPYGALWLAGSLFWAAALQWLRYAHWAAGVGLIPLACYLGAYLPVFVGLSRVAVHRFRVPVVLAAPIVWTGLELLRGHLLGGFTMASLGHTQYRWIALIQMSDLGGAYGVSFVVMLVAACLARIVPCEGKPRVLWPLLPAAAVVAAALLYGHLRTSHPDAPPAARIAIIQGSIDTEIKFDENLRTEVFKHYFELSQAALRQYGHVDLAIWPETMFRQPLIVYDAGSKKPSEFEGSQEEFASRLRLGDRLSRDLIAWTAEALDVPLLLGIDTWDFRADKVRIFNSAVLTDRHGNILDRYDKMHPVVFGEYLPFVEYFPCLQRLTPVSLNLTAGTRLTACTVNGLRLAPNICYETVLPHFIRQQVNTLQPDVLVNLTNDGWFWGSSELDMHLACGVFRAVECRKPWLIAANTGFSAWIDADGRIVRCGPRRATGTILAEPQLDHRTSWYLEYGDWAAGVCLGACMVLAAAGFWTAIRDRRKSFPGND